GVSGGRQATVSLHDARQREAPRLPARASRRAFEGLYRRDPQVARLRLVTRPVRAAAATRSGPTPATLSTAGSRRAADGPPAADGRRPPGGAGGRFLGRSLRRP